MDVRRAGATHDEIAADAQARTAAVHERADEEAAAFEEAARIAARSSNSANPRRPPQISPG